MRYGYPPFTLGAVSRYNYNMKNLQPNVTTYTIAERATRLYNGVVEGFITDKTSDVVTPFNLALEQVRQLPNREGNVLVPGAGVGTYILALLQEGFKPEQITAVELDPAYSRLGYGIFSRFGINYITTDFTYWQPDMQFDVVIGNPPFQEATEKGRKDQASNLWSKFWIKSLELAKGNGYVSLITPTSWMSPSANLKGKYKYLGKNRLWDVFSCFTSNAQVTGVAEFFKGVGSSFGIVTVDKSGCSGLKFVEGYSAELGFLPKSGIEEVLEKVGGECTLESSFVITQDPSSGWRVSAPLTRKVTSESVEILKGKELPSSGSSNPGLFIYTLVSSEEEAVRVRETVLGATDILNVHCRWSGFMNIKIFKMLNHQP